MSHDADLVAKVAKAIDTRPACDHERANYGNPPHEWLNCTECDARAVLDALGLREVTRVDYDIVATDEDRRKVFQHGGDDPWRLRQLLADHPNRYRPGSRVERRIGRWLITDGTGEWERWEPIP